MAAKPAKKIMDQLRELSLDGFEEVMAGVVAPLMVLLRRAAASPTPGADAECCACSAGFSACADVA